MGLRVGIVSLFYGSYTYGVKLQAYALTQFLKEQGCQAEQICYAQSHDLPLFAQKEPKQRQKVLRERYRAGAQKALGLCLPSARKGVEQRKAAFDRFDQTIAHTCRVYSDGNLAALNREYDVFLAGADQIWDPDLWRRGHFLGFAQEDKYRFSYAASMAGALEPPMWASYFQMYLKPFEGVSVREASGQQTLSPLLTQEVALSVDPVLLLERSQWERAMEPVAVEGPYLFCYFLGDDPALRRVATAFAKAHALKIVTLPHSLGTVGRYYPSDAAFGDERLYDVTPGQFLSLVQRADCVLTDSYYGAMLSVMFRRNFCVCLGRSREGQRGRVQDLLGMFGLENRCGQADGSWVRKTLEAPVDYGTPMPQFFQRRQQSLEYLADNLRRAEEKCPRAAAVER
jgi:hypothetical protein